MKKLLTALIVFSFTASAYALTGSFFQNDREYGLTDEFYSVSEIDSLNSSIPEGCMLLSCNDALTLRDELNYSADYFFCDRGVIDNYRNSICSIVDISGQKYVECNGTFLDTTSFRAFVSCPISSENITDNETDNSTSYIDFVPDNNTYYCAKDINGNNFFDNETEIQQCIEADNGSGYVCPIDKVSCEATYEEPLCPEGTLNTERDMCQSDPLEVNCPSGYTWDFSLDKCVLTPSCPDSGILNTVRDRCEKTVINECPSGYTYDSTNDICWKSVDCGDGVFVPERNRCEKSIVLECPTGYTLSNGTCIADPVCPTGTVYNSVYDECLVSYTPSCPSGYTYNNSTERCEATPTCPSGFTYNPVTNRCEAEANVSYTCSSNNQTYSSLTECQANCQVSGSCSENTNYEFCLFIYGPVGATPPTQGGIDDEEAWNYYTNVVCSSYPSIGDCLVATPKCPSKSSYNDWKRVWYIADMSWMGWIEALFARSVSSYTCSLNGQAYSDLSTCQSNCVTTGTCSQVGSCPSGSTLSGSLCIANPSCPSGGTFDGNGDVCWVNYTPSCPSGTNYDSTLDSCIANPTCSDSGVLNTFTDKCELTPTADCGSWTYDNNLNICYSSPVCSGGIYNANLNECVTTVTRNCGTYLWDNSNFVCYQSVNCPTDSTFSLSNTIAYSSILDKCVSDAEHICPSGDTYTYTWNKDALKCELVPICANGVYTPETDGCYVGNLTCPVGDYPCMPVNGESFCSPNSCQKWIDAIEDNDTLEGADDKKNDGEIDENGNCLGTIYIFNGYDKRCRTAGLETGFSNCCKKTTTWFGLGMCKESEKVLAKLRSWGKLDGQCHYVGSYCSKKILKICVQKKKTFCCFNSVLARIIQEQGRPQLGIGWGSPKHPNCRGFTPSEFQKIDFSKIDFSEWLPEVEAKLNSETAKMQEQIENAAQEIQDYYKK